MINWEKGSERMEENPFEMKKKKKKYTESRDVEGERGSSQILLTLSQVHLKSREGSLNVDSTMSEVCFGLWVCSVCRNTRIHLSVKPLKLALQFLHSGS